MAPPSVAFTADDYRTLPETGPRYQLVDGDLILTPAPHTRHQRICRNLEVLLVAHTARPGGGEVLHAPFDVYLDQHNVLQPDILLVLDAHAERIGPDGLYGPPDLAIEIASPATAALDRGTKRKVYARHGTQELWLVDHEPDKILAYRLQADPEHPHATWTLGESATTPLLPGLEAPLTRIFPSR